MSQPSGESAPQFPDLSAYRRDNRSRGSAVSNTVGALREAILDGALKPGQWLREESLAESFGVSRTPLREALNRLEEEGLIERERGLGARVTSLTLEDMLVVYQVRGSLESVAASIAAKHASTKQREQLSHVNALMRDTAEADDSTRFNELNISFHQALASAATNVYLKRLLGTVETAIRRFGTATYTQERMQEIVKEHDAILAAINLNDQDAATRASLAHAESARSATLRRLMGP